MSSQVTKPGTTSRRRSPVEVAGRGGAVAPSCCGAATGRAEPAAEGRAEPAAEGRAGRAAAMRDGVTTAPSLPFRALAGAAMAELWTVVSWTAMVAGDCAPASIVGALANVDRALNRPRGSA